MDKLLVSNKCAPGYTFEEGSCFTLQQLHNLVDIYNKFVNMRIINISNKKDAMIEKKDNKLEMVQLLLKYLKATCDENDICLIKKSFLQHETREFSIDAVRPYGPSGQFTWLNTLNINHVIEQYAKSSDSFEFIGSLPMDFIDLPRINIKALNIKELYDKNKYKIGVVFNTDNHNQPGQHWIAAYCDLKKFQLYYFDSVAMPPHDNVRKLMCHVAELCYECKFNSKLNVKGKLMHPNETCNYDALPCADIRYNKVKHQRENSECGVYCINFIIRMLNGTTFDEHNNTPISDAEINTCRQVYFHDVNLNIDRDRIFDKCE